jgi:hypothetical protein
VKAEGRRRVWPWAVALIVIAIGVFAVVQNHRAEETWAKDTPPLSIVAPASTTSATVTAPKIEQPKKVAALPKVEEEPAALDLLRDGEKALVQRDFAMATKNLEAALHGGLKPHQEALARLGLAIAANEHERAREIARMMNTRWPADPALHRVVREFPEVFNRRRGRR